MTAIWWRQRMDLDPLLTSEIGHGVEVRFTQAESDGKYVCILIKDEQVEGTGSAAASLRSLYEAQRVRLARLLAK